jgi:ribosomal protein S18 acetylase RimI-like enzyme
MRARAEELDEAVAVLSEAAAWLRSRGIDQWPHPYPAEWVAASIEHGETYLARENGAVAGTITLRWADRAFWGDQPPVAGYVHGLAVRREFAGRGPELLEWAAGHVRAAGREFVRLDCRTDNAALRGYYERHGFEHRGDTVVADFRTNLYERRCSARAVGAIGAVSERRRDRHVTGAPVRSQRERGWSATPPS